MLSYFESNQKTYQVLEYILRQALMLKPVPGFYLEREKQTPEIGLKDGPSTYVEKILSQIEIIEKQKATELEKTKRLARQINHLTLSSSGSLSISDTANLYKEFGDWVHEPFLMIKKEHPIEEPTKLLKYGFEKMIFRSASSDEEALENIHRVFEDEKDWVLSKKKKDLEKFVKESFLNLKRSPGRYLSQNNSKGVTQIHFDKHDFFKHYIALSDAIYRPFFQEVASGDGHRYYQFLAAKLKHLLAVNKYFGISHDDLSSLWEPKTLSQRIKQNRKFADLMSDQIKEKNLVNSEFFRFLMRMYPQKRSS